MNYRDILLRSQENVVQHYKEALEYSLPVAERRRIAARLSEAENTLRRWRREWASDAPMHSMQAAE